jgi:ribonuclease HI
MKLSVYFDGSCGPRNPGGTAAWGFVIKNDKEEVIGKGSGRALKGKDASNNVGEFEGLYQSMIVITKEYPHAQVVFRGDATLVINIMNREAKARRGRYMPYYEKTMVLASPFIEKKQWTFEWIPRALNSEADELSQYHRY